jgi:L-lactate dehydrogenase complex protein LldG
MSNTRARENILGRVRKALNHRAPKPPDAALGQLFSPINGGLVEKFRTELELLHGEFHEADSSKDAAAWLKDYVLKNHFQKIARAPQPEILALTSGIEAKTIQVGNDAGRNLQEFDLGITGCSCLIARTGTVMLTSQSGHGRVLSVLPHAHLVIARRSQLVPDLKDAYEWLRKESAPNNPSMVTFITGPSRTADIEKILVLGAHGPKRLAILLFPGEKE